MPISHSFDRFVILTMKSRASPIFLLSPITCFFLVSLSYKLAWTTISSLLSQFARDYGPSVLLQLNIAYFFPSIPVLILMAQHNHRMDKFLGLPFASMLRLTVGVGGLSILLSFFLQIATSRARLLMTTALIGVCYGIAFGTSYQLASKFSPSATVALTTGFVSSGPVVLALDLLIKTRSQSFYDSQGLVRLYSWASGITFLGLVAAYWLVVSNIKLIASGNSGHRVEVRLPGMGKVKESRSSDILSSRSWKASLPISTSNHSPGSALDAMESGKMSREADNSDDNSKLTRDTSLGSIAWKVAPAALSIFLSVGTSMLVFPLFTFVRSTGLLGDRLAQVLFYVRLVGDIAGRVVPKRLQITSPRLLVTIGLVKLAMVPLVCISIFYPSFLFGDVGGIFCIGIFWWLSGYLNSCSYLLAPLLVPYSQKSQASSVMTVAFQSSCFLGLMGASALVALQGSGR